MGGGKVLFWLISFILNIALYGITLDFGNSLNYLPYFSIGVLLSDFKLVKALSNKVLGTIALLFIFMTTALWSSGATSIINILVKLIVSISLIIVVYKICIDFKWNCVIEEFVMMCGMNSMAIYCVHRYFTSIWPSDIPFVKSEMIALLYTSFCAVAVCYLCFGFKKLIEKYPFLDYIMFGSIKKRGK